MISRGVADVYAAANVESLDSATTRVWCERWLESKKIEAEESTHVRYERIIERFLELLDAKAARDLSTLQASDVTKFRDREAKALSRATANLSLKVLRVCFGEAVKQGLLAVNPATRVSVLKSREKSARRAFTVSEIKRILDAAATPGVARARALRALSRATARRSFKADVARGRSGERRDCVHDAQDRTAARAPAR